MAEEEAETQTEAMQEVETKMAAIERSSEFMQGYVFGLTDNLTRPADYHAHMITIRNTMTKIVMDNESLRNELASCKKLIDELAMSESGLWLMINKREKEDMAPIAIKITSDTLIPAAKVFAAMTTYWEGVIADIVEICGDIVLTSKDGDVTPVPTSLIGAKILTSLSRRIADMEAQKEA